MTVLAKVLDVQVCQLILALDVVDAGLALPHQFLHENVPHRDVLCARTVGTVADDVQRRRIIGIQRHAAEVLVQDQLQRHVGAKHRPLHCQSCRDKLCLRCGLCGQPLPYQHLEADRGVGQHHDV